MVVSSIVDRSSEMKRSRPQEWTTRKKEILFEYAFDLPGTFAKRMSP